MHHHIFQNERMSPLAKTFKMKITVSSFTYLFLLFIGSSITSFPTISSSPIGEAVCRIVDCRQGTCKASNDTIVGYDCECYPGWAKHVVGPVTFPSCIVPNCTLNLGCTEGAPSPQPFPFPLPLPPPSPLNISDPCGTTWCGDGVCLTSGTSYTCQCNEGAFNLMNSTSFPCLKPCSFGSDCHGLYLPQPPSPSEAMSPLNLQFSSPSQHDVSTGSSPQDANSGVINQNLLTLLPLAAMFLTWI